MLSSDRLKYEVWNFLMKFIPSIYQGLLISHTKFHIKQSSDCGEIQPKPLIFVFWLFPYFGRFSIHDWNFSMKFIPKMYPTQARQLDYFS